MSLLDVIVIEIGAAIAKLILKLWVKDTSLADNISSSLIDLLKSQTSDILAQRRGQRQFDIIGEKVGENLLPLLKAEDARLEESSRIAVAQAIADAFNKAKLSSGLLAEHKLEPARLTKHILAAHPTATQRFSATETGFYERIIEESCSCIVDVALQLPTFSEHTFAEVLKKEDTLTSRADQTLEESRRLREALDPMVEAGRFEIGYRKTVARNMDVLQLLGVDTATANRRHRLSVAYITLSVEQKLSSPLIKARNETGRDIVSVDRALATSHNLIVRGPAGSGKTTLLQWIAVRSATRSFEGQLSVLNDTIPFYIRLRQHVESRWPRPEAFPGLVAPSIADTMPIGWVHTILKSRRAIVLVDGLDEVPMTRRESLRKWLQELVDTYPKTRFIITSRPHALEEGWIDHPDLSDAELQPMQLSDIYSFIDNWHKAVGEELYEYEEKAQLKPLVEHLKNDVKLNRSLRSLATNPLLCAMLCALNRDRNQQLPADRVELYEACCSLLLERREKARGIDLTEFPTLNYRQKCLLLEDVAYWMIKNGWSEIPLAFIDERFSRKLKNMPGVSHDASGPIIRRFFVERTGMIRELGVTQIDFTHRTFQEFLAAKAALDEMDLGVLVGNAHNDQWREVTILACGLAAKPLREQLIRDLIARGDREKEHRSQLHLLAVSCLEMSVELGQEVRAEVEQRLSQLVPPKNMEDAKVLAAAGDLAVKYLTKGNLFTLPSQACVHALALIGSDAALEMLEGYANDTRTIVVDELIRAWDSFDGEIYASRVLSQTLHNTSTLHLERRTSLNGIQHFTSLTKLTLSECTHLNDLSPLTTLINLTSLTLSGCAQLHDLRPLAHLTQLRSLDLSHCLQISDLSPLAGLKQLTTLTLSACPSVDLANLTQLTTLDLSNCSQLTDLKPLASLLQLRSLNLSSCSQIDDFGPLEKLMRLTSLNLSRCYHRTILSLTRLRHLISLDLSDCSQLKAINLVGLTSLRSLTVNHPHLNFVNLTGLAHLTSLNLVGHYELNTVNLIDLAQLTVLNLSGCFNLRSFKLAGLPQLTSLNLSKCYHLSDLSFLVRSTQLTSLDLSGCAQLGGLSFLAVLLQLTSLNLSNCSQFSTINLAGLSQLTSLNLSGCAHLSTINLAGLSQLTSLNLSGCARLSDLGFLTDLPQLTSLNLSNCSQLDDLNILAQLKNLKEVVLYGVDKHVIVPERVTKIVKKIL